MSRAREVADLGQVTSTPAELNKLDGYTGDHTDLNYAKDLKKSNRNEYEITDLNIRYLNEGLLKVELLGEQFSWLDTGTPDSLLEASNFIQTIEKRQGKKVACIEEIAFNKGYINSDELKVLAQTLQASEYGQYLLNLKVK